MSDILPSTRQKNKLFWTAITKGIYVLELPKWLCDLQCETVIIRLILQKINKSWLAHEDKLTNSSSQCRQFNQNEDIFISTLRQFVRAHLCAVVTCGTYYRLMWDPTRLGAGIRTTTRNLYHNITITMTSYWAWWSLNLPASPLFTQPFIEAIGEFPAQRAGNAENVSIWWRHHACGW